MPEAQATDAVTCPACRGTRTVYAMTHLWIDPEHSHGWTYCDTCQGSGSIPAAHAARIADGERRRADRIARGLSLRDEAKRLGIEPRELSDIENGRETDDSTSA